MRQAVLAEPLGMPPPTDLDADFADELRSIYHSPGFDWPEGWARGDKTRARIALAWMARHADPESGVPVRELLERTGLTDIDLYWMLSDDPLKYAKDRAGTQALLERTLPWPARQPMPADARRVRLRSCPHCRAALVHVLRVPELPDGTVCAACRHAPSTRFAYHPDYLQPWIGPMLGRRKSLTPVEAGRIPVGSRLHSFQVPPRVSLR